jgi:hypothetical protein
VEAVETDIRFDMTLRRLAEAPDNPAPPAHG